MNTLDNNSGQINMNSTESTMRFENVSQERDEEWDNDDPMYSDAGSEKSENGFVNKFLEFSRTSYDKYVDGAAELVSEKAIESPQPVIDEGPKTTNTQPNAWYCELCPTFYMHGFRLKIHYQEAHPKNQAVIDKLTALLLEESHKKSPQYRKPTKITCEICQKSYYRKGELINHYNEMHPIIEETEDMPGDPIYTSLENMEEPPTDILENVEETITETIMVNNAMVSENNDFTTPAPDFKKISPNKKTKHDKSNTAKAKLDTEENTTKSEPVKRESKRLPKPKKFENFISELKKTDVFIKVAKRKAKIIDTKLTIQNIHRTRKVTRIEREKLDKPKRMPKLSPSNSNLVKQPNESQKSEFKKSPTLITAKTSKFINASQSMSSNYKIIKPFKRNIVAQNTDVSQKEKSHESHPKNCSPKTSPRLKIKKYSTTDKFKLLKHNQSIQKRRISCRKSKPAILQEYVYTLKENTAKQTDGSLPDTQNRTLSKVNISPKTLNLSKFPNNSEKTDVNKKSTSKNHALTINKTFKTVSNRKRKPKLLPDFVYHDALNPKNLSPSPVRDSEKKEETFINVSRLTTIKRKSNPSRNYSQVKSKKNLKIKDNTTNNQPPIWNSNIKLSDNSENLLIMERNSVEFENSYHIPLSVKVDDVLPLLTPKLETKPSPPLEEIVSKPHVSHSQSNFKYAELNHLPVFSTMESLHIFDKPDNNDINPPVKKKRGRPRKPINVEEILLKMKLNATRRRNVNTAKLNTVKGNKPSHTFPKMKKTVQAKSFTLLDNKVGKPKFSSQKGEDIKSKARLNKYKTPHNIKSVAIKQKIARKRGGEIISRSPSNKFGTHNVKNSSSEGIKHEFARKSNPHSFQYFYDNNIVNPMSIVVQKLDEEIYKREVNK